ncbi:MAG: acetyl-CoA C-acyltransferase [Dongiaceae bacterium]
MREAVIVNALRTPVGKAPRGALRTTRPDDMAAAVITELLRRSPEVAPAQIDDVILGCAMPEAEQGGNVARIASFRAGLPESVSAMTINRFCSSGLQAIALAAERVRSGGADVVVAGGTESMSLIPRGGHKPSPNPALVDRYPDVYLTMGLTAENVVEKYKISREDQDAFALRSHRNALAAQSAGKFDDELVPLDIDTTMLANGRPKTHKQTFAKDEGPRGETSLEALAKLKPVFHARGTVTAGNASQTSDGAAAALVMSEEKARQLGLKPMARFVSFATAGVAPEIMGIGPVEAIPKALKLAGLRLDDIDLIELNEAFAGQALAVIRQAGLPMEKVNVNGGAVALGHPLGATGARLSLSAIHELHRRKAKYALVTMCVGGGMGAAWVFESEN